MNMISRTVNSISLRQQQNSMKKSSKTAKTCRKRSIPCLLLSILLTFLLCLNIVQVVVAVGVVAAAASNADQQTALPPHMAALTSTGGGNSGLAAISSSSSLSSGGGSSSSSSILEQFSPNCTAVAHIFQASGISLAEIPQKPSKEVVRQHCESPSVGTCCTYNMENKMATQSRSQLEKHSKDQILKMTQALSTKAQKFNDVFRKLLLESKEEFHNMFMRTYGVIYQQNSYVFSDLFNELESYYARGRGDLLEVMDKFFNILYQKMFQVLNAQYTFDQKYLHCVSQHMKELKPFGDVPDKLSLQIKRSFVATRTYAQALGTAAEVAKRLISVRLNSDCTAALTKMQHCGACKGYAEKPCTNYCVNVIKGCLHYLNEFDIEWENFVSTMDKVAERLLGSFNIVMVVEPINIKISEAIMNFQDAGQDITNRVFQGCGRPTLGRAKRSVNPKFDTPSPSSPSSLVISSNNIRGTATLPALTQAEQLETDILDIDAALDESIVLRERRSAEPGNGGGVGAGGVGVGVRSSEENSSPRSNNNAENRRESAAVGGGTADRADRDRDRSNNNRRQQNNRRNKQQQQNRNKNDDNDYTGRDPILDKMVREIRQRVKDSKKFWSNLPHEICNNDEISTSSDVDGMCWNGHTIDRYMHSVSTEPARNPEFPGNPATQRQTTQVATQLEYLKNAVNQLRNAYKGQDVDWSEQEEPYYGSGSGSGGGSDDEDDDEGSGIGIDDAYPPKTTHAGSGKTDHTDHPIGRVNNVDDEDSEVGEDTDSDASGSKLSHTTRPKYTGSAGTGDGVAPSNGGGGGVDSSKGHETNVLDNDGHHGDDDDDHDNSHDDDDDDDDDAHKNHDDIDDGAHRKSSNGGGPGAKTPARDMSLRRALLLYLLPLYMAWFGGIFADLL